MNNPTYLNQYRRSLLDKQQELLAANGGIRDKNTRRPLTAHGYEHFA